MESFSFNQLDLLTFAGNCFFILILFFIWRQFYLDSRKGQAWMIMLLSSFVLTLTGFYYAINAELNRSSQWTLEYIYGDDLFSRSVLWFFTSCNVMDLLLGIFYYHEFLYPLTTICHHIFFIAIVLIFLGTHTTRGFLITFVFELPTFLLSVGTVWPSLRNDFAFGITFFATRICFHVLAIWRLAWLGFDGLGWKVLCLPFLLHLHWFYKWIGNYLFGGSKKKRQQQSSSSSSSGPAAAPENPKKVD
jgi:hypothetical protein